MPHPEDDLKGDLKDVPASMEASGLLVAAEVIQRHLLCQQSPVVRSCPISCSYLVFWKVDYLVHTGHRWHAQNFNSLKPPSRGIR